MAADPTNYKDRFSSVAPGYASFRPRYPPELFAWLAGQAPARDLAWDCATGNGQAATGLAAHFRRVIATDASRDQIRHATPVPNVEYRVARAEASGLAGGSVDLVTVAQALHWLDWPTFYAEVRRVARPDGVVAAWGYGLALITPEVDRLIDRFHSEGVGPYWDSARIWIVQRFGGVDFPFAEIAAPEFVMQADWTLADLVGYLRTWSAVAKYREVHGRDPVADVEPALAAAWGPPDRARPVSWPLFLRVGRVSPEARSIPSP